VIHPHGRSAHWLLLPGESIYSFDQPTGCDCAWKKDSGPTGLFNSLEWNVEKSKNVYMYSCCSVLCIILAACVGLTAMCIYVINKCLKSETLINSKIWASQAENSQAKPLAWEAVQASPSHMVNRKTLSALRKEQGWTHSLWCWQRLVTQVCMRKLFELLTRKWSLCAVVLMMYDYANDWTISFLSAG
jgi:hypothetical protein